MRNGPGASEIGLRSAQPILIDGMCVTRGAPSRRKAAQCRSYTGVDLGPGQQWVGCGKYQANVNEPPIVRPGLIAMCGIAGGAEQLFESTEVEAGFKHDNNRTGSNKKYS